jgi:hypothetical protein
MNGTRLTSEKSENYTVLGRGPDSSLLKKSRPVSLVNIIRGRKYQRLEDIRHLASLNYFDTIVMLPRDNALPYEELVSEFPNLRLFLFDPPLLEPRRSPGTLINLGIREAAGEVALFCWGGTGVSISQEAVAQLRSSVLCYVPQLRKPGGGLLPSMFVPAGQSEGASAAPIKPVPVIPDGRENESLFPPDYLGLYIKERFTRVGGYDESFSNPYWQKLEFGYRSRLWGERIAYLPGFRVDYHNEPEVEESTPDEDYLRLYLRTQAIRYTGDRAQLPAGRFWAYYRAGNSNLFQAWERFAGERRWVKKHRYHYRFDLRQLVELWGEE